MNLTSMATWKMNLENLDKRTPMTMPNERRDAVNHTRQFLVDLMNPKKTPRVPSAIRKEAYRCLKHYPGEYHMEEAEKQAPKIFGDWDSGL